MNIRKALEADAQGILRLLIQVNNVHSKNRPDLFIKDKTKYTKEELLQLMKNENSPIFVAVDEENDVLGYAFCVFQSHVEDNNFPDIVTLYIDDICVDENCRGNHVGTALYEYVKAYAKENGCYNVTLNVWDKNDAAIAFYEKCGFHIQKYGMEVIL
ncbi:MAG: GNAT family N-acetyltransferase [Lachnospiraceae bacterium]